MKNKTSLVLMEQLIMVLVFALSAAVCLQIFVLSDRLAKRNEAVSEAALVAQNVAEELKVRGGSFENAVADGEWIRENGSGKYQVEVQEDVCDISGLVRARIFVMESNADDEEDGQGSEVLFEIPVAWQEVENDGE